MDHFDNCAAFEDGFGRAVIAFERKAGHMGRMPAGSFSFYGGGVPTVSGLARTVLAEIDREGTMSVDRTRRPFPLLGSADIGTQLSSLLTRGLIASEFTPDLRILTITDLGRQSLAASA